MLSGSKLKGCRLSKGLTITALAQAMVPTNISPERIVARMKKYRTAISNWERNLYRPHPRQTDIDTLARVLGVDQQELIVWSASHRFAPIAPRKVKLVVDLIRGRSVQDALDVLRFTNKRAAVMVEKVISSAVANADEQEADVEKLYVSQAWVDGGGIRPGTRRWRPKDRGRAVSFTRLASHINVTLDLE